ncbi:dimethylhistidine N-methyltransferase [Kaistella treverensis]|uniref:Dimethylhistidine N-methyltransferase n=1 Tax=Kaistella treverensis TaxID=631455 RepID=A0A1I3LZ02_9FLAO|nr:L-histidine N(alpha)-methyltransferase [Kaistella treverensis]SFI89780.1 dimethylhistidine N-methyltransferase [Kaistella treverensis]
MTKDITFLEDIKTGFSHSPKYISSQYFYDKAGDKLFQQIMNMPEYYLTDAEMEIFKEQSDAIIKSFELDPKKEFELIELGAGDGKKTQHLLKALLAKKYRFTYIPVDISQNTLNVIESRLDDVLVNLEILPKQGDFFQVLEELIASQKPKVVLFIGSTLGNMPDEVAKDFLNQISAHLKPNEKLLLGLDQIKPVEIVLPAYNDAAGITREFNLNLLRRINRELEADFIIENFEHAPEYDEIEGIAKSYLKSKKDHTVFIKSLNQTFHFAENELIHTEISRKYNDEILNKLISESGLEISEKFLDKRGYFADYILTKK